MKNDTPTISDIAKECSLAIVTVSKALNNKPGVNDETRKRVLAAAKQLGYVPDLRARAMRTGTTQRLGMVLPSLRNPYYLEKLGDAQEAAWQHGYDLIFQSHGPTRSPDQHVVAHLLGVGVDGIVFVSSMSSPTVQEEVHLALRRRVPLLKMGGDPKIEGVSSLRVDVASGAEQATRHLLRLGHRHIALLGISTRSSSHQPRIEGVRRAIAQAEAAGATYESIRSGDVTIEAGYEAASRFWRSAPERPTAIFALNDQVAMGAMAALHDLGLRVPQDVAVVGHDNTTYSGYCRPALTTVSQTHLQMDRKGIEMLVRIIKNPDQPPQHIVLPAQLIVRESCGARLSVSGVAADDLATEVPAISEEQCCGSGGRIGPAPATTPIVKVPSI